MNDARRKLRLCLILVVTAAVVIGVIYYFHDVKGADYADGTLVSAPAEMAVEAEAAAGGEMLWL